MKTKTKKMIAPVVIVALISIYYIAIGVIFAYMNGVPMLAKIIALVVPALLSGVAITVLIQRIKEIKKGEDDDLSKSLTLWIWKSKIFLVKSLKCLGLSKAQLSRPKMSERISCRALKILLAENLQPIMR